MVNIAFNQETGLSLTTIGGGMAVWDTQIHILSNILYLAFCSVFNFSGATFTKKRTNIMIDLNHSF